MLALRLMASLRAKISVEYRSLAAVLTRVDKTKPVMFGAAMVARIASIMTVISNSITVKPAIAACFFPCED